MTDDNPYAFELALARTIDPDAETMGPGAWDCLLVANEHADAVLALFPGAYRDDNDPPTPHTRVLVPLHEDDPWSS